MMDRGMSKMLLEHWIWLPGGEQKAVGTDNLWRMRMVSYPDKCKSGEGPACLKLSRMGKAWQIEKIAYTRY